MEAVKSMVAKVDGVEEITKQLAHIDLKLVQQGEQLDQVQT